jgi:hypothetical protein
VCAALAFFFVVLPAFAADEFLLSRWIQPVPRHSVLTNAGYFVWCGSVVQDGGQYHMFFSRWPGSQGMRGWLTDSEIAHAVADNPGGPFTVTGLVLGKRTNDPGCTNYWDSQTQHNPRICHFGNKFYLYYMASVDPGTNVWPGQTQSSRIQRNQRIGVIVADSIQDLLSGNFVRPSAPIVSPVYSTNYLADRTNNPADFAANRIVNNQTVVQRPDGKYQLIYKSNWPQAPNYGHGYALADDPAGPFTLMIGPVFSDQAREDEFHWYDAASGKYFLTIKNFNANGDEQLQSLDGTNWTTQGIQLGKIIRWDDGTDQVVNALERPEVLRDSNGVPVMLYLAMRPSSTSMESYNIHIPLRPSPVCAFALTNVAEVKNSGALLSAVNFGATTNFTVNGLTFTPGGTNISTLTNAYGFVQSGGANGATLAAGTLYSYVGQSEFKGFLDTAVYQTGNAAAGARLQFLLKNIPLGHTCRLQLFFGDTRAGSDHGPQTVDIAGQWPPAFDYGPDSALVLPGAAAVKFETSWVATRTNETVVLSQRVSSGGALQISAYALHEVTPPSLISATNTEGGNTRITWHVMPGYKYSVWYSDDLSQWTPDPSGTFQPGGSNPVDWTYMSPTASRTSRYYRLEPSES